MKQVIRFFRRTLRDFRAARRGNVTVTFALATLPIVGFVGAAVDYSRANSVRTSMQAALDSTALMLSKEVATLTTAQINQKATDYFNSVFNRPEAKNIVVTPSYSAANSSLTVSGAASVSTNFMSLMGFSSLDIGSSSTVTWGNVKLRVALVLDNTGSMADGGKMTALKTAAKNLLSQLKAAAVKDGDVYVAIIPFSKDVNVGSANYTASWISWTAWDASNGGGSSWGGSGGSSWGGSGGSSWGGGGSSWGDGGSSGSSTNHSSWNGCVMDRDQDYDTTNAAPTTSISGTLFPAEQYAYCPVPLMPLSYDWTALNNKIDAMTPNGNTNQTIGLQWGFQALTANSPLPVPAMNANYKYQQVIILLTDGLNTENRWTTTASQVDARTQKACNNIKAAGITLYTVLVMSGNSTILQNCASDSNKYFALTTSGQIITAFNEIGTALTQLRIAK